MLDFAAYIARRSEPLPITGCWLWMGQLDKDGYGQFRLLAKNSWRKAHRVSYEAYIGPIPEGLGVLHKCSVRCCVNPSHLYAGTQKQNVADQHAELWRKADVVMASGKRHSKTGDSFRAMARAAGISEDVVYRRRKEAPNSLDC